MNLKVGDFLIRVEGDLTSIAVIEEKYEKDEFYDIDDEFQPRRIWYDLQIIASNGESRSDTRYDYELEYLDWKPLDVAMLRTQS